MKSLAFTGHRYLKEKSQEKWSFTALDAAVTRAMENGITWFTSGGAPYWDWWFADACLQARWQLAGSPAGVDKYGIPGLPDGIVISLALPFRGFLNYYADKQQDDRIYIKNNLLQYIAPIVIVTDEEAPTARHKITGMIHDRNRWLVDNHDAVMALYDGRKTGGTYATLQYARKQGKPILWLNPVTKEERWITQ